MIKPNSVKIIQITSVKFPSYFYKSSSSESGAEIFGLGDDGIPYKWDKYEQGNWIKI